MSFEDYLTSKKIDASAFKKAEPSLFESWQREFDQMHANSFTVQKLNLINPIRRKYLLPESAATNVTQAAPSTAPAPANTTTPAPRVARPVIKPKIN